MNPYERIDLLQKLGTYITGVDEEWELVKERAELHNPWFIRKFIGHACMAIAQNFLEKDTLQKWLKKYFIYENTATPKKIGLVMAGNIPLAGFHDLLCVFITGQIAVVKPSSKDEVLMKHIINKLIEWDARVAYFIIIEPILKNCDAYIATGSNNSAGYFNYYFGKYPNIIRRNRVSVAVLDGNETDKELSLLASDIFLYFGLGCRNVSKLYVPLEYNFENLIKALQAYDELSLHHKLKNNYDYNLALHILNHTYYMSTQALLLIENSSLHSPLSQVNYEFYSVGNNPLQQVDKEQLQCIMGHGYTPFGTAQYPVIDDYADGVDTMDFLLHLNL